MKKFVAYKGESGRRFLLQNKEFYAVSLDLLESWRGKGVPVTYREMMGAAIVTDAQLKMGATREDAEEVALIWLEDQIRARNFFKANQR